MNNNKLKKTVKAPKPNYNIVKCSLKDEFKNTVLDVLREFENKSHTDEVAKTLRQRMS